MYKQFPSLAEAFLNYFQVDLVTSPKQQEAVERIRYNVYCKEFDYEPADAFPGRRESDVYDSHSLHCLITHRRSKMPAACVRMVAASESQTLPFEDNCRDALYLDYLETIAEDRSKVCEISRLAVDATFRRRPGEDHTRLGEFDALDCSHQEQRTFSLIGFAALMSALSMAHLEGRTMIFGMMEPTLARLLRRAGVLLQQAGEPLEYHGQRVPYFITTDFAVDNMRDDLHRLYEEINDRIEASHSMISTASVA